LSYQNQKKKKSKHPQLTVAFLLTLFQMNVWLFTCGGKNNNLRLTKIDMEKRDGMQNKNPLGNHNFFCQKYKRKNCAIFICPYRETAVASNPCNFLIREAKNKNEEEELQISIPQITKVHNLARFI